MSDVEETLLQLPLSTALCSAVSAQLWLGRRPEPACDILSRQPDPA